MFFVLFNIPFLVRFCINICFLVLKLIIFLWYINLAINTSYGSIIVLKLFIIFNAPFLEYIIAWEDKLYDDLFKYWLYA